MKVRNVVEEHVTASFEALRPHFPTFCGCDVCSADVLVFGLNRVRPRYVATREGMVMTEISLERDQSRAAIDVVVMEGFRKVMMAPRCGHAAARPSA